ncbi:arsenate reductase [Flavobacterium agricola]|uniref:Arsenate reductase n=1 Tax=Flavobacterium agricola TaxID=2870839 RepID=A0ABY6LXP3_9FLAO|nr:ArsC/Spx/MgsR family protein [Flavobacterium agricola]UYW01102.1 arsenate reductase [Flavobacterium agricola]
MNKIYYLSTCDTCKKIMNQIHDLSQFELIDIKTNPLTENQVDEMYAYTKSFEKLFSKRAQLYKQLNLKEANLNEAGFKKYLLEHYTFLARPVIIFNNEIFVGNSPKNISAMLQKVNA